MESCDMSLSSDNLSCQMVPNQTEVIRVAQVSDSHIFKDPKGCLLGLNTRTSFEAVCQRLAKEEWCPDLLLATGDLSQDASPEAYGYLADYFQTMGVPTFWIPGNHDILEIMTEHLNRDHVLPAKQVLIGNWQIILLNSAVPRKVHGHLLADQLEFLDKCLGQYPDRHALVTLHHQPKDVGAKWLDQIGLDNRDEFMTVINRHSCVKCVLWGHVHQEFFEQSQGVDWISTPSSCVQFAPLSEDFAAGREAPGYRYLSLFDDGRVESVVHRIDNLDFTVDYSIKGY